MKSKNEGQFLAVSKNVERFTILLIFFGNMGGNKSMVKLQGKIWEGIKVLEDPGLARHCQGPSGIDAEVKRNR